MHCTAYPLTCIYIHVQSVDCTCVYSSITVRSSAGTIQSVKHLPDCTVDIQIVYMDIHVHVPFNIDV